MGKVKNRNRRKKSKPFLTNGNRTDNDEGNGVAPAEEDEFSRVMSDIVEKLESPTVMDKLSALLLLKPFSTNDNRTDNNEGNGVAPAEEDKFSRVMSDIVDKLESPTVMDKLSALLLLSEMVDLKQIRSIIIEHEICKIVGPLLLDSDIQVCLNAAGAISKLPKADMTQAQQHNAY
ncbi:uncharacterized protein LOC103515484 [Diaphorina citri]|uniref:Uncharacterized protein LOC103515484 n=1 Tax=Diaphorina citri TaxID=121845 RepID=A0A1S3DBW9_DIACI|nr:uncharacterized protein LOC103515484 [Diaphorina citri]